MRTLILILTLGIAFGSFAQSGEELDRRNGFKDIKLLSDVNNYPGLEYWKEVKNKPDHHIYRAKKGAYDKIGDVDIIKLSVYTYKSQVYQIDVVVEKNEQLYRSLEKAFGKINSSIASRSSYWEGKKVRLTYSTEGKKVKLSYLSKEIKLIINQDKKKDIDSLSTEF